MLEFFVHGVPSPQGSKSFKGMRKLKDGRQLPILAESAGETLKSWRMSVATYAHDAIMRAFLLFPDKPAVSGPVHLDLTFSMVRPKYAKSATALPAVAPDLDKLLRATGDALTQVRAWEDDSRVVSMNVKKVYVGDLERGGMQVPGALIRIKGVSE